MSSFTRWKRRSPRPRQLLKKCRRLGQTALFAAVRGAAYTLGAAASAWLIYWITHR